MVSRHPNPPYFTPETVQSLGTPSIVGISESSFSQAVKDAIEKLINSGKKLFWFEIIEQRGAVKGGKIEYQVKLKVALESTIDD